MHNSLYISTYTGYQSTFRWTGYVPNELIKKDNTILAIDSVVFKCFGKDNIDRDLKKCHLGFKLSGNGIATGQWGCGAFSNDPLLKLLQQVMVLSDLGFDASFHWLNENQFNKLNKYVKIFIERNYTIGMLYNLIIQFDGYVEYFDQWLNKQLNIN
jgi:hypothetical protein